MVFNFLLLILNFPVPCLWMVRSSSDHFLIFAFDLLGFGRSERIEVLFGNLLSSVQYIF